MKGKNAMGEILPKQWLECGKVPEKSSVWKGLSTGGAGNVEKIEKTWKKVLTNEDARGILSKLSRATGQKREYGVEKAKNFEKPLDKLLELC